jgi:uncharacterized membrane protein YphA (DoxX/SURF4 family)
MKLISYKDTAPASVILIRCVVGLVFFSEGIQKFLFPDALGIGRFVKIGIPAPQFFAPFVGIVEILFGFNCNGVMYKVSLDPINNKHKCGHYYN